MKDKIENPFKKIILEKELPDSLKEKVINDINLIKLSLELSELYFVSIPEIMFNFLDTEKKDDKKETTTTPKDK